MRTATIASETIKETYFIHTICLQNISNHYHISYVSHLMIYAVAYKIRSGLDFCPNLYRLFRCKGHGGDIVQLTA
jgi:hypothetical protein